MHRFDEWMTKLAYSRVLTMRFQVMHLAINYSLLALACIVYLIFSTSSWVIALGAIPGAIVFLISAQAFSYRRALEGGDMFDFLNHFIR